MRLSPRTVAIARRPRRLGDFSSSPTVAKSTTVLPTKEQQLAAVTPYVNVFWNQIAQFGCPTGFYSPAVADFQSMFNTTGLAATAASEGTLLQNSQSLTVQQQGHPEQQTLPVDGLYGNDTWAAMSYTMGRALPPPGCPPANVIASQNASAGSSAASNATAVSQNAITQQNFQNAITGASSASASAGGAAQAAAQAAQAAAQAAAAQAQAQTQSQSAAAAAQAQATAATQQRNVVIGVTAVGALAAALWFFL